MAAPYPPQGQQVHITERPPKFYGEQYLASAPLPIGVRTETDTGETVPPYIIVAGIYQPVFDTDWVITNRYNGQPVEVISAEEFSERFNPG
jgi:hypothetical protein